MARKPRIWFEGAMYHITSRGNRQSALFYDNKDRVVYLKLLEEVRGYLSIYSSLILPHDQSYSSPIRNHQASSPAYNANAQFQICHLF